MLSLGEEAVLVPNQREREKRSVDAGKGRAGAHAFRKKKCSGAIAGKNETNV